MLHQFRITSPIDGIAAGSASAPKSRLSLVSDSKLEVVPDGSRNPGASHRSLGVAFIEIAGARCSTYLAEAAVLVLVFAILDRFLMKERMEWIWASGAVLVSLGLLAASVAVEVVVRRLGNERSSMSSTT